jgi:hypothetical protein
MGSQASADAPAVVAEYLNIDRDRDNDPSAPHDDTNNGGPLQFGHEASPADWRAVAALVKRYYEVALSGDGARGCTMIYSTIAESLAEDYGSEGGQPPGPPYMHGKSCPVIMTGLFRHFHPLLAVEVPKLRVLRVRMEEHHGVALLGFGDHLADRTISFVREGHAWKLSQLTDIELP